LKLHAKQGYHIKLTVERIGAPGAGKHKVFWLQPCQPTEKPTTTPPPPPGGGGGGGGGGQAAAGEELPITGSPVAATAGLGLALIAGGLGLILVRRRFSS
jgi:LPXTG-motif cell wall-anchored protein